jgi:hypothetical protein
MGPKKERGKFFLDVSAGGSSAKETLAGPYLRHSAAEAIDAISWSERVDSRRQPRQLSRDRILVEHALCYRPMQLGLR